MILEEEPWETSNKESAEGDGPNPELEVDDADGGHDNEEPGAGIEYAKPAQADTAKGASQEVAEGSRSGRWELRGSNADRQEVHDAERSRQQERQERDVGADAVGMQGERGRGKVELLRVTEEEARHWERAPGIPHSLDKRQTREGWVGDGTRLPERQLMRKGGWEGEPSIPNGYWRQEERRKEGPSSPGRHGQRQGERSGEALSSGPPEQWERRIGGGFRSPHARQQQSGEGGRDRHSPEGRRHQRRGEAWSPSPERQRQRKTSAAGWRDARVSLARLKARAEEWRGLRERRGDSSWNQQESKTGRGSLAYGAEQAREAREGPARFSGDQRAGPTLKNYLMQVGIVKYRCDRQGMDPIDFFLSLPNTLEGEAETLYRMRMDELLWRAGSKFLGGLDEALGGGLRMRVYELGAEASLEEVFDLLERVELAQRKYEAYLPKPTERSRRPTWAAAMIPEGGGRTDGRGETGIDTRTCHRCGQPGHLQRDCKNCDGCGKPRHRKRECPDAAKCEICKKQGHKARDCYQREGGTRRQPEELQRQISRLQAQLRATGLRGEAEAGMYATDEDGEEVEQDVQSALMAWRGREEMGLRSRGKDGRQEQGRTEQAKGEKPAKPALEQVPACHPQEVLACHRRERRTRYWKKEVPLGELPVRSVNVEPKRAYQAVGELLTGEQQAEEQGGIEGLMGGPRMRWMDEPKRHSDWQQPIHLVELFGGIGAGLSAVIRSGIAVRKWTYVEKEPVVRKMVEHHAWKLQAEFPDLLSGRVVQEAMGGAVHDGKVAYLLENLDLEGDSREPIRLVRERIKGQLGGGVSCDAARTGSYAHRLRMYWQNVVSAVKLQAEVNGVKRAAERKVQDILALGRTPALVCRKSYNRHYPCNQVGQERRALPTLVLYAGAAGYKWEARMPGPGMVYDHRRQRWEEPTALERELAMRCQKREEERWEVMSKEGKEAMQELLARHRKCFAFTMQELGRCKVKEMELKLSSTEPMFHRKRKMPHGDEEICKEKIKELEEVGLIRRSESKYATPTVVAARRDRTGEVLSRRMCGDYMALNKITIADRYPIPMAEEIFDKLAEGRVMDSVLRGVECAACYIDDVVIFSTTKKQHLQDVERTLTAIEAAGLTCHPKKCRWGEQTVLYLGYEVKGWQIGIQQAKVEVLDRLREPKDKSGLRAVLGFLSYYRRFVPNFSKRATVLNGLLREDKAWEWGEAQKGARQDLMTAVKTAMLLKLPTADQPFTLYTDWRSQGMGGILCQEVEGEEKVVAYASRSCNLAEAQYSSYIGEGLAAAWAVGHFRVYLQGREFTLVTDHQPLTWLMTTPGLTGRNAR
ncbi:unnamed protein product [Closterium sp. NIES-53]